MELRPDTEVDRYRVERVIGRGGMAAVYRVRHVRLDTVHALKVLELPNASLRARLLDEGRVQARLAHPNVVAVSDVLDVGGRPGLLMELVQGPSLDRVLAAGALPLREVDALVPGILAGVAAAHAIGVVHRDLKPANVLLHVRKGVIVPKVGDFGLVKTGEDSGRTRTGMTMGTPAYMSPEQVRNTRDVDARTDLFALGALLYELVVGQRAFDGDSTFEIHERILKEAWPRTEAWDALPQRVKGAIEGALRADRDARIATVEALWALWADTPEPLGVAAARPVLAEGRLAAAIEAWRDEAAVSDGSKEGAPAPAAEGPPNDARRSLATWASTPPGPAPRSSPPERAASFSSARRRPVALLVVVAGLGLTALCGLMVVAPMATMPARDETVDPSVAAGAGAGAGAGAPMAAPVTEPAPSPPPPERASPAPPDPRPAPTRSAPPPEAPATVTTSGDLRVRLVPVAGGPPLGPGEVPPGVYRVEAEFGGAWDKQGTLELRSGERRAIRCDQGTRNCLF